MRFRPFTMFDSVTLDAIPPDAYAVAGYVGGQWPTFPELVKQWPKAKRLSIAIAASEDADCLDVEPGDATNAQAAEWVKRQWARGVRRPVLYTSVSNWPPLQATLTAAGVKRRPYGRSYKRWSAHYTFSPHRCTAKCWPGFKGKAGATQYTDRAAGRNLDASLCRARFL